MKKRNVIILACIAAAAGVLVGGYGASVYWGKFYFRSIQCSTRHNIALFLAPLKSLAQGRPDEAEQTLNKLLRSSLWQYDMNRQNFGFTEPDPPVVQAARAFIQRMTNSPTQQVDGMRQE